MKTPEPAPIQKEVEPQVIVIREEAKPLVQEREPLEIDEKPEPVHEMKLPQIKPKREWEKPSQNYNANYGPNNLYADFKYKNMSYDQTVELRKKKFLVEQNNA